MYAYALSYKMAKGSNNFSNNKNSSAGIIWSSDDNFIIFTAAIFLQQSTGANQLLWLPFPCSSCYLSSLWISSSLYPPNSCCGNGTGWQTHLCEYCHREKDRVQIMWFAANILVGMQMIWKGFFLTVKQGYLLWW